MQNLTVLKQALQLGLSVVTDLWNYKTKSWVTSVHVTDVDNDGDLEIIVGSRDGRVHALSNQGERRWERIVGRKTWIGAVLGLPPAASELHQVSVLVGTQDGKVYALDKDGRTLSRDRQTVYSYDKSGWAVEGECDAAAFWHSSAYEIGQLTADLHLASQVVIGSKDHSIYALDYATGEPTWTFPIPGGGWVSAVFSCDLNGDGLVETLVGSSDQHLYTLDHTGTIIAQRDVPGQVHAIYAADVNQDGRMEILLGMDQKDLVLITPEPRFLWRHPFDGFQALCVADVDGDGRNEILVGAEDRHLYILDEQGEERWRHFIGQRISCLYAFDVDNDGQVEVLVGAEDSRLRSLRIDLDMAGGLDDTIRACYEELQRPPISSLTELTLPQRALLQDLVTDARSGAKSVTLEQVEKLMAARKYGKALDEALSLYMQRVQLRWHVDPLDPVKALCFGDVSSDSRREIVVGTDKGRIYAFNILGNELWSFSPGGQIVGIETGYVSSGKWAEVIVGSTDHHIYVISGTRQQEGSRRRHAAPQVIREVLVEDWMSSLCVNTNEKHRSLDLIVGTKDKKIYIYERDLEQPVLTLTTPQVINVMCACLPEEDHELAIVAGCVEKAVYAYTLTGKLLWEYSVRGCVEALCMKDIDNDGAVEVIVGSQDCNVHVLDEYGRLKWRYYLPNFVLSVDALDIDSDGRIEILAACQDDHLYVLSKDGDLLWKYQAPGHILVARAQDIDDDKKVEIAIGLRDTLELLQVVDRRHLSDLINRCWRALVQQAASPDALIHDFLADQSPRLRSFALRKLAEQAQFGPDDFKLCERFIKDGSIEVRYALIRTVMHHYQDDPDAAQALLAQISMDQEQDIRLALVKEIGAFIKRDVVNNWESGFKYLQRFARNTDRLVRRAVMRELYPLMQDFYQQPGRKRMIFEMLLLGVLDGESRWVRNEAARTLAHFLDLHHGDLLIYLNLLIVRKVERDVLQHIAYHAQVSFISHVFLDLCTLIFDLDETNMAERVKQAMDALEELKSLRYGEETFLIYKELHQLLGIHSIDGIAQYQCSLNEHPFTSNTHYRAVRTVFKRLHYITLTLESYLKRYNIKDRVNSLLDAQYMINETMQFTEQVYATATLGETLENLPDHTIFKALLRRWQEMVTAELRLLSGKVELVTEIQTRQALFEERVAVWLLLRNNGRIAANNVEVELLSSEEFEIIGSQKFETEIIFAQDEVTAEFTIRPRTVSPVLMFEISYVDSNVMKTQRFEETLELRQPEQQQHFTPIDNPYSTGVPTPNMCYGREEDLDFLRSNLARTSARTLLVLYGQRRSGKTTLLFQLAYKPLMEPHIPLLIDMQHELLGTNQSRFFFKIAYHIAQACKKRGVRLPLPDEKAFGEDPTFAFERFLDEAEEHLQERKLIILIDEFEALERQVKAGKLPEEIFEYLRSLVQHRQKITFLLSGGHNIRQMTGEYSSVFFNIAMQRRLSRLSQEAAVKLITMPVNGSLEYEAHAVTKIRQLTDDQPYLIHLICRRLVDYCNERKKDYVTINDVNTVSNEIIRKDPQHFEWLWEKSSPEECYLLAILAERGGSEGRWLALPEIEAHYGHYPIPFDRERVLAALDTLVERDVVEVMSDDGRAGTPDMKLYRICVGLVREWLRKTKPDPRMLRQHADI